jgi:hypothetical protein
MGNYYGILTGGANLLLQPIGGGNNGTVIQALPTGTWVEVFAEYNDFDAVILQSGQEGWIGKNALAKRTLPAGIVFSPPAVGGAASTNDTPPSGSDPGSAVPPDSEKQLSELTYNGKLIGKYDLFPQPKRIIGTGIGTVYKDSLVRIQIGKDGLFQQQNGYYQVILTDGTEGWLPVSLIQVMTPPPGSVIQPTTP